jgi:hypothetical protein
MRYFRNHGCLGQVLVCPLHLLPFLTQFGFIDFMTHPETVIYDEVDVYYKTVALDQFHRFYSANLFNMKAGSVIFASATIQESIVNITDTNLARPLMLA